MTPAATMGILLSVPKPGKLFGQRDVGSTRAVRGMGVGRCSQRVEKTYCVFDVKHVDSFDVSYRPEFFAKTDLTVGSSLLH